MPEFRLILAYFSIVLLATSLADKVRADSVAEFYTGKTITLRVGFGPGGGYDITARIVAKRLGAHIPGNPRVVVENYPGAGGIRMMNTLYNASPKDGTVLGASTFESALEPLNGNENAKFDPTKFTWIGSAHRDISSCGLWQGAGQGIKSFQDFRNAKQPVMFGSTGPQTTISTWPLFMKNALNAPAQVVHGYSTTRDIVLAMSRKEVHAVCGLFESSVRGIYSNELASGDLLIFLQAGLDEKVALFGNAPQITDVVSGMGAEMQQIVRFLFGPAAIARPIIAPPDIPADRAAALRKALLDTMRDPIIVADGQKMSVKWAPISGEEVSRTMGELSATPKPVIDKAVALSTK